MLAGSAVVALLAAGAVTLLVAQGGSGDSPEDAAIDYLRALESGDAEAVEATGLELPDAVAAAFEAATDRPQDGTVEAEGSGAESSRAGDGDSVTVPISYALDGRRTEARLTVTHDGRRWVPDAASALGSVRLSSSIGSFIEIGDAVLSADRPVALLPGSYRLAAAPGDLLAGSVAVDVAPGATVEAALDPELRPEATEAAQRRLDAHLATCTETRDGADAGIPPEHCGLRIPWGADLAGVSGIRFRVEQPPAVTLDGDGFVADGGVLVATVSGAGHDGAERSVTYRTENWTVRGDVTFTADGIELSAW